MKFIFKLFGNINNIDVLKINRGYNSLKMSDKLDFIDILKGKLTHTRLFDEVNSSIFWTNSKDVDVEMCARQYILSRYVGIEFNREILKSISGSDYRFVHPIPYLWLKILVENGIRVNIFLSLLFWYFELLKLLFYSFFEFLRQVIWSIRLIFSTENHFSKKFIYFDALSSSNIPNQSGIFEFGILPWFLRKYSINNIDYLAHSVKNNSAIVLNDVIEVRPLHFPFSPPSSFKVLFKFVALFIGKVLSVIFLFLIGKWWNILLFREYVLYEVVRLNNKNGLAVQYFFNNSCWLYRPLWTYAAEANGSQIIFYFYSTNIERFKKPLKNTSIANSWEIITWPKVLVWDIFQHQFLKNNVINTNYVIEVIGPIGFQSSNILDLSFPDNLVAVFDVQPVRHSYYISLGLDQEYYIAEFANKFLNDVISTINCKGLTTAFKRKRNIGRLAHYKYTNEVNLISKKYKFFNIDPEIPAEFIIGKAKAVISMPFTSTALVGKHLGKPSVFYDPTGLLIKDDPAAHGIRIINNKDDLKDWLSTI